MEMLMRLVLAVLAVVLAMPAAAHDHCRAPGQHERFGEQRAYFQDVLAACRADGFCSAVVATKARDGAQFAQQLRIARPSPREAYQVDFAAASPMPAALSSVDIRVGRLALNAPTSAIAGNEFRIAERADIDAVVAAARKSRSLRWTYKTEDGIEAVSFGLRGMTAALTWIDCMSKP
jgi:hypothetical protein